jgi:hypothetical protein
MRPFIRDLGLPKAIQWFGRSMYEIPLTMPARPRSIQSAPADDKQYPGEDRSSGFPVR